MHAADVADQLAVQEDPHIIVAEEEVFQGTGVILGQFKLQSELHAEEAVVVCAIVTGREHRVPADGGTIVSAKLRVLVLHLIHGPEVIGENVVVCRSTIRRIVKPVQVSDARLRPLVIQCGRRQRIDIALPFEGQAAAFIGVLALGRTIIEEVRMFHIRSIQ